MRSTATTATCFCLGMNLAAFRANRKGLSPIHNSTRYANAWDCLRIFPAVPPRERTKHARSSTN